MAAILLAGDIGGTKTDLGLYTREAGPRAPLVSEEFHSADYASLEAIVREFLKRHPSQVDAALFDVAGPVINGRAQTTNLPWVIDEADLRSALNITTVRLMNDLEAVAAAVPILTPDDLHTLNQGTAVAGGSIAVIAPGTGLGESFLTYKDGGYETHSSEGGHSDFGPADEQQAALLQFLRPRYGHVSWEHVCSGVGIPNLYEFLRQAGNDAESPALAKTLADSQDKTRLIINAAQQTPGTVPIAAKALDLFVSILGSQSGNLALTVLATGGVYLGGGIPEHIMPALQKSGFLAAFQAKGRMKDLMSQMPVHVIVCQAALIGAASEGLAMLPVSSA